MLQATSCAKSASNQALVSLDLNSLKKKFEFDIPAGQVEGTTIGKFSNPSLGTIHNKACSPDCHGAFIARDASQLTGSNFYVDYTNTRIMIYRQQGDPHPLAVVSQFPAPRCVVIVTYASQCFTVQS